MIGCNDFKSVFNNWMKFIPEYVGVKSILCVSVRGDKKMWVQNGQEVVWCF